MIRCITKLNKKEHKCVSKTDTNPPFAFQIAFPRGTDFTGFLQGGSKSRYLQSEIYVRIESRIKWESMGNFCILAVFERYLSNACTHPHQILFVYGQCLPTCPLPLWDTSAPGGPMDPSKILRYRY